MNAPDSFRDPIYEEETLSAERELSSFIAAVTKLYGAEHAKLSAEDWLEELDLVDSSSRSRDRHWRAVTIAAANRLANRINAKPGSPKTAKHNQYEGVADTMVQLSSSTVSDVMHSSWRIGNSRKNRL